MDLGNVGGPTQTLVAVGGTGGEPVQYLTLVSGGTVADISDGRSTAVIPKNSQLVESGSSTTPRPGGNLAVMIGNKKINLKIVSGSPTIALVNKGPPATQRGGKLVLHGCVFVFQYCAGCFSAAGVPLDSP